MKKRIFLITLQLIVALTTYNICSAQQITYTGHPTKLLYSYQKALALPNNKLLVIYGKNNWLNLSSHLHLIVHDKEGNVLAEKTTVLHYYGFDLYFKDAFVVKNTVYFLCINNIKRTNDCNYMLIKMNTDSLDFHVIEQVQFNNLSAHWLISGEYHLCFSPDSSMVGFVTVSPMKPDFTKNISVAIFDAHKIKMESINTFPLGNNANAFQMKDIAIANNADLLMLVKYYIYVGSEVYEGKSAYKYLLQFYKFGKLQKSVNVTSDSNLVLSGRMQLNKTGSKVIIAELESNLAADKPLQISLFEVNTGLMNVSHTAFIKWPQDFDTTLFNNGSYKIFIDYNYPYHIFLDNQKVFSVEGARVTHGSDYYRGKLVCLETDSLLNVKELRTIDKYQLLDNMPEQPFTFDRNNSSICYVQNTNKDEKESACIFNINTDIKTKKELNSELWNKRKSYNILSLNGETILIQPQLKTYLLAIIKPN